MHTPPYLIPYSVYVYVLIYFSNLHDCTLHDNVFTFSSHDYTAGCTDNAATSACAVNIVTNALGTSTHFNAYNDWRVGDDHLDWYGAEVGQGSHDGRAALGTPMAWTTNDPSNAGFHTLR